MGCLVHATEHRGYFDQDRARRPAPKDGDVGRVPQFGRIDRFRSRSADVLLRDEIRGSQRHGVVRIGGWKELADERHRADLTAAQASRAARVPRDDERRAAASEVPGVRIVLGDLPSSDETDTVWMQQPLEAFPIRSPTKVGAGIDGPLGCALETRRPANREQSTEDALDRHVLDRQRRFAFAAPDLLIGIREQRVDDVPEPRSRVLPVFGGDLLQSVVIVRHLSPPLENDLGRGDAAALLRR